MGAEVVVCDSSLRPGRATEIRKTPLCHPAVQFFNVNHSSLHCGELASVLLNESGTLAYSKATESPKCKAVISASQAGINVNDDFRFCR